MRWEREDEIPHCPSIVVALQTEMRGFFASLRMTDKNNSDGNDRSRSPSGMTSKKCNCNNNNNNNSNSNGNGNCSCNCSCKKKTASFEAALSYPT